MAISFSPSKLIVAVITAVVVILQGSLPAATGAPLVRCYGVVNKTVAYTAAVDIALADMVENTRAGAGYHRVQSPTDEPPLVFGVSRCARNCAKDLDTARLHLRTTCPYYTGATVKMGGGTYMGYSNAYF